MKKLICVLTITAAVSFVNAQPAENSDKQLSLGAGVLITNKPYKGADSEVYPIPALKYEQGNFRIDGLTMSYKFFDESQYSAKFLFEFRGEGYDQSDSPTLDGMDDRDYTFELGLSLEKSFEWGNITGEFLHDIAGRHKGHETRLYYSKRFQNPMNIKKFALTPKVGVNFRSGQLNNYYYGVKNSEANGFRSAYKAGSSAGFITSLLMDYELTAKWNVLGIISFELLGDEITDSPIVGDDYIMSYVIAVQYKF